MSLIPKKGTVYVVDDDEAVRDSMQWLLEGKDYKVRCFDSAESFLARYDTREVACLLVDVFGTIEDVISGTPFWDAAVQMDFMDVMIMYARLFDEADFWLRN